ncbi:MAG: hypothetical protein IT305_25205 [Chloroflexi bacterium]|nr:hypothetical protein [Chloroflexota bacterium]
MIGLSAAILVVVGALSLLGWLLVGQVGRPFVYDDVNFALGARAVAETGQPYGNQGYLLHLYWLREQWALWHPPLYVYTLGLAVWLFGAAEEPMRGLGITCLLVAAALAFDLARRTVLAHGGTPTRAHLGGAIAVALYLLNPLAIQASMVLDIDNTLLLVLVTLTVWAAVRAPGLWGSRTIGILTVLFALALWSKLTTPLALGAAFAFTRLFQRTGWRGMLQALVVVAMGSALFVVTWIGVSALTGMPIDYTLDVVRNEALESSQATRDRLVSLSAFANGAAPALLWIGPFSCLLFVSAGLPALWRLLRGRGLDATDLLVVLGAAIYLAYIMKLAGGFPKYHVAMLPLWAAASGALVVRIADRPTVPQYALLMLGTAGLYYWWMPSVPDVWGVGWNDDVIWDLLVRPGLAGLAFTVAWAALGRRSLLCSLPVALAILALGWSVGLDLGQRDRPGSTTYFYGRYGNLLAADAVQSLLMPDETYVASKDVAWYLSNQRYVDQDSWQYVVWELDHGTFDGAYLGIPIRVLVLEVADPTTRQSYEGALLPRYRPAGEYGNYLVLVRAP